MSEVEKAEGGETAPRKKEEQDSDLSSSETGGREKMRRGKERTRGIARSLHRKANEHNVKWRELGHRCYREDIVFAERTLKHI